MYVIKMNSDNDKSLVATIKANIYQGEKKADTLVFLLPKYYEDKNLSNCTLLLRYILPNGIGKSEELEMDVEPYKEYYKYRLKISTRLTDVCGKIELWLSAVDFHDNFILKTSTTYIDVIPTKNISDYLSDDDMDELDKLNQKVQRLSETKADDIVYNEEDKTLHLTSNGAAIGSNVNISSATSDDIIDVESVIDIPSDDDSDDNGETDTSVDVGNDEIIQF